MTASLDASATAIDGLIILTLPVHADARGWFKENWQREKMAPLGLGDFTPVQHNVSFNAAPGTTRGIHAEPWDKYVSVASGSVFGAWVDLRKGPGFGTVVTARLGPGSAVFVPRGVGNAFQTLEKDTAYTYLVNDHWSAAAQSRYTYLNLADETVGIDWPIDLAEAEVSAADRTHPRLNDVTPMAGRDVVVLGAGGQIGRALRKILPAARFVGRNEVNLADPAAVARLDVDGVGTIINAAAFTNVDAAESETGRRTAWAVNAAAVAILAGIATRHQLTLVHLSSDYVFDGTVAEHHEQEALSPLGVYGQTKAAGDLAASGAPRHYIVRTSWVVGDGGNFVRTMASLADRAVAPRVVDDQFGRLSFSDDLAAGIVHLLDSGATYGTYNLTNTGPVRSWAQIAADVYRARGADPALVTPVSTEDYVAQHGTDIATAPRPRHSALSTAKLEATGFTPRPADAALRAYLADDTTG
ncbi:dTDP-4-dehydrorhamnose reductase [Tersicoccus phoenicis]|uniref:dTDP-4-dehydrorhamnose reductase n=1 Tax=Tersicoccus phoenicis TaxID=554083 RepID=A0A1R1L8J8_9MICC|nr:bifunctional dTDP-4-dehydrorhamnose 3,5-epimerase family protein/NAD(P)-dependent oxidoreductase [Tersicoccus phoenicis]OMH23862.1 dTDP-4-dehydrorhamnose reductase [Tersicoccus phoenicis]